MAHQKQITTQQPTNHGSSSNPFLVPTVQWSAGLYDCCNDMSECCYAYLCPCCFMHSLGKSINEESLCGCCIPNQAGVYRMKIRTALHIEGTAMNDCFTVAFCGVCAAVQMKLELKNRGLA
ncbi:hypothetical protein I4U23_013325 [Adineta vaga]|nr:hypothetical protein I4U23_013325 [Adineta vaga]